jgi:hypothetical protein
MRRRDGRNIILLFYDCILILLFSFSFVLFCCNYYSEVKGVLRLMFRFKPKYGTIVQNKDEFTIPLTMEQIPPPKVFKDSIASLSPVCSLTADYLK